MLAAFPASVPIYVKQRTSVFILPVTLARLEHTDAVICEEGLRAPSTVRAGFPPWEHGQPLLQAGGAGRVKQPKSFLLVFKLLFLVNICLAAIGLCCFLMFLGGEGGQFGATSSCVLLMLL